MRILFAVLLVSFVATDLQASGGKRRNRQRANQQQWVFEQPATYATPVTESKLSAPATPVAANSIHEALDEVNAERAKRGLQPYIVDPLLTQAAKEAASRRASKFIHGHLPEGDFSCLPSGGHATAAGCGALEPSWGWGSCCTYDSYTYAGAAWVMGSDGRRYMHLFVR